MERSLLFALLVFCSFNFFLSHSWANLEKAPPAFQYQGKKIIFADFLTADYHITFDQSKKETKVKTQIRLKTEEGGHLVFDSVAAPVNITLDGVNVEEREIVDPEGTTTFRILQRPVEAGEHLLVIDSFLINGVDFAANGVHSGFFMTDLGDRSFLEKFLPANFEYDQVAMTMKIDIVQNRSRPRSQTQKISPQLILTNGNLNQLSDSSWQITFPPYFTSSSLYFHTFPQGSFALERFSFFTKTTGREVPIALYTRNAQEISGFKEQIINVLTELEADYGEWPHPNLVVYGAGSGGMEYCGATRTSLWALDHELTHSYFARGILSSHGNSGWIDEAVASWRDQAYPRNDQLTFSYSKMAGHSLYRRSTDNEAYSKGAQFLGHLDYLFANQGGLKKFLADFFIKNLFNPIRTVDLEKALESYFKASLGTLFQKYIYGKLGKIIFSQEKIENPYHPILSEKELRELL